MKEFKLPDLGEGLQEVEIISWHVGEGDNVVADQPLLSVETDKAVVEVPAPVSGRILRLHGKPGEIIKIGSVLVEYDQGEKSDAGSVVGNVPQQQSPTTTSSMSAATTASVAAAPIIAMPTRASAGPSVMPAVRALAQKLNVDLSKIQGTGSGGMITREDVELATLPGEGYEPLKGPRKAMAMHMAAARDAISPATIHDEANINHWFKQQDVTSRLIMAMVAACREVPALNAWFDRDSRKLHTHIDLGIAVDTEDGLFVPVLRNAGGTEASQIRGAVDQLKQAVQGRTISSDQLKGQTITLSNFGMMAGKHASMVIVPPQVAILGAGGIHQKVVAVNGQATVQWILPLSLTIDHRAVTGGEAARFLAAVIRSLQG